MKLEHFLTPYTKIKTWDLIIDFQNKQTAYVVQYQNNKQPNKKNRQKT